ncbi:hypothetical protein G4B88_005975 [Cannabis sativa]|uniref:Transposase (putative) gypsy type domain-containing protein n=1 Tax=Cannabis sativa TaxID=3483 RepID=A0A7J6IC26_CANSA|nr:hypothetical protein G4B88_005975 [Cannabis sativa]
MVALSESILKAGVPWLLNPFFIEVLKYFGIAPLHLMPNGWNILTCFYIAFKEATGRAPTANEVHYVYNFQHKLFVQGLLLPPQEGGHAQSLLNAHVASPSYPHTRGVLFWLVEAV